MKEINGLPEDYIKILLEILVEKTLLQTLSKRIALRNTPIEGVL